MTQMSILNIIIICITFCLWPDLSMAEKGETGIFEDVGIESGGDTRNYRMVVPPNYDPAKPIGVLFGYHGGGPFSFLVQLQELGYELKTLGQTHSFVPYLS